jgi:hypothetical protein
MSHIRLQTMSLIRAATFMQRSQDQNIMPGPPRGGDSRSSGPGDRKLTLSKAQIGRCGELFVQYRLLRHGVESAPMTTDTGIDLVAYSPKKARPITIQVKTNLQPKPGGGRGKLALDWWISETSPAAWVALVDLETQRVWLLLQSEFATIAQQKSGGRLHFYFYTELNYQPRISGRLDREYEPYLIEQRIEKLFDQL